jgi:SAM-dependent methyltransferase
MTFTPEIYEQIREGAKSSAAAIVPLALELVRPKTVVDVGCGEGWFAREFAKRGCSVVAIDSEVEPRREVVNADTGYGEVFFIRGDVTAGDAWAGPEIETDLAVCLEVAEHLPPGAADAFIGTLCALAPAVLFSAAIPGQGGHGHLNEQWPGYWADLFLERGFAVRDCFRRILWGCEPVEPWYRQNLLLFARAGHPALLAPFETGDAYSSELIRPLSFVHPNVWEHRRQR